MNIQKRGGETLPGGSLGPPSGARPPSGSGPDGGLIGVRLGAGLATEPHMGGSEGQGTQRTGPRQQKLAQGTWNVTSLCRKEPELVREVERYQLDLVRLTSMQSLSSGTILLDMGWTLFFSGVAIRGLRSSAGRLRPCGQ